MNGWYGRGNNAAREKLADKSNARKRVDTVIVLMRHYD